MLEDTPSPEIRHQKIVIDLETMPESEMLALIKYIKTIPETDAEKQSDSFNDSFSTDKNETTRQQITVEENLHDEYFEKY